MSHRLELYGAYRLQVEKTQGTPPSLGYDGPVLFLEEGREFRVTVLGSVCGVVCEDRLASHSHEAQYAVPLLFVNQQSD